MAKNEFYVYCITNLVNGKKYIGKGTLNRIKRHFQYAARKEGDKDSLIVKAIRKYGHENFSVDKIAENLCERKAFRLERLLIRWYRTNVCSHPGNGYNQTDGGEGSAGNRFQLSESARLKSSIAHRKPLSAEHRAAIRNSHQNPAVREKISLALKGRKVTAEALRNMKKTNENPETKKRRSEAARASRLGKHLTAEAKAALSRNNPMKNPYNVARCIAKGSITRAKKRGQLGFYVCLNGLPKFMGINGGSGASRTRKTLSSQPVFKTG